MRAAWRIAWQRHCAGLPLEPLQAQMAEVVGRHPEYHAQLAAAQAREGTGVSEDLVTHSNPYLHLALHLALREQLATNRPQGISALYRKLCTGLADPHAVEHRMIEILGQLLWEAQRSSRMPDEKRYLAALQSLGT